MKKNRSPKEIFALYETLYKRPDHNFIKKKTGEIWKNYEEKLNITKPQNYDSILRQYNDEYYNLFKRLLENYPYKSSFYLGFYNIENFNAESSIIDGYNFILIDRNLKSFYLEVILALYHLTYTDELSFKEKENINRYINYSFQRFHYQSRLENNSYNHYDYLFDNLASRSHEYFFHSVICMYAILYFILGHELGHFYYGHSSIKKTITRLNKAQVADQELEADLYAYRQFLHVTKDIRPNNNTNVSHHFDQIPLLMFDILARYYREFTSSCNFHSHPPPQKRKEYLLKNIKSSLSTEGQKMMTDLRETLDKVIIYPIDNNHTL